MNSRALSWGKSCSPFSTYIVGSVGVLDAYIGWNHFSIGIGNYIYPEMKTSEIGKIKEKYQDGRILIIPILRNIWGVNTGMFGWKEYIKYEGVSENIVDLEDKGRKAIVYYLRDLNEDNIKSLLTIECKKDKIYKEVEGKRIYSKRKPKPQRLPLYFLLEGYNGRFGKVNLWDEDYSDPKVVFNDRRKKVVLHLFHPDVIDWKTFPPPNSLKYFLEP